MVAELKNFRAKYPQYDDIDDQKLAGMLAQKYPDSYGDLPKKVVAGALVANRPSMKNTQPDVPQWGINNPNLYGLYGAGKAILEEGVRPTVEALGMVGGGLLAPIAGSAIGFGMGDQTMDIVEDAYKKLGNEQIPQRTIPGELIDSAVKVGGMAAMGKTFEVAAPVLKSMGKYAFDTLPKKLYASAVKLPLSRKWVKALPGREVSKRTAVIEEGLRSRVPPSDYGAQKARMLEKEVHNYIDDVTALLSKDPSLKIRTKDVINNGLKKAYRSAGKSSDPKGNTALIDDIAEKFKAHGEYITPQNANAIKRELYKEVNWGEVVDPMTAKAKKGMAKEIMHQLETIYPEIKTLNQTDAARIGLIEAIERAAGRTSNNNVVGLGTKVLLTHPHTWPLALWESTMGHPQIKARLAFTLAKANPQKYSRFIYPEKPSGYVQPDKLLEKIRIEYKSNKPKIIKLENPNILKKEEEMRLQLLEESFKELSN